MDPETSALGRARCLRTLAYGLGLGFFYPLFILGTTFLELGIPALIFQAYWALVKLALAYGILCWYRVVGERKVALVGLLLILSGLFTFTSLPQLVIFAGEALALVGLSLVLFDISKGIPALQLEIPSGLIFLGVIFYILNVPAMQTVGLAFLLLGFLLASQRLLRVQARPRRS